MRLTIIGATGRTGKHLVVQALDAGYEVIAFVRNLSKLTITHERLTIVQGDATDPAAVERAIQYTDAVICVLNSSSLTRITQNILNAMKIFGVRRLIITSAGIPQPNDLPDLRFSLLLGIGKLLMPPAVEDTINSAHIVQSSDIDWTIIRMAPTNATPTGQVNAGYVKRETKDMNCSPTGCVTRGWAEGRQRRFAGTSLQPGTYQKTRRVPPVGCTLC